MPAIQEKIAPVQALLRAASARRGHAEFRQLFRIFDDIKLQRQAKWGSAFSDRLFSADVFSTLDAASRALCDPQVAICSAVMTKGNGLPGIGFFDNLYLHQRDFYRTIAAGLTPHQLLEPAYREQAEQITELERQRVYRQVR